MSDVTAQAGFGERFVTDRYLARFTREQVFSDVAVERRHAIRVLDGVPWQFIPTQRCQRRAIVGLHTLLMLCCCLDQAGASPGNITTEQMYLAWKAAGHENLLRAQVLRALRHRADQEVLRAHPDLLGGAIMARLGV